MSTAGLPVMEPTSRQRHDVLRVGVIGYGYWGPNIVRNVTSLDSCQLVAICVIQLPVREMS